MKITIIGAGPGGYETAIAAAKAGIETVLVESGHVGGTCLNAGCIPTKALCRSARFAGELRDSAGLGIAVSGFHVDFPAVMARKNAIVEQLRTGVETMLSAAGVTLVHGRAVLKDAHKVASNKSGVDYTFHNFGRLNPDNYDKIDFIFITPQIKVNSSYIPKEADKNGQFLSDHNPEIVHLSF